jgi:hypothetical protein
MTTRASRSPGSLAALALALTLALAACAPVVTGLQPAKVGGGVGGSVGLSTTVPVGPIANLVSEGAELADKIEEAIEEDDFSELSREDLLSLMRAGAAALTSPPGISGNFTGQYGFRPDWEAGITMSGNAFRGFVRNQVLSSARHRVNGTWGVGLGYAAFSFPVSDLEPLAFDDFTRLELEGHFLFGWSGWLGHLWTGPRVIATGYKTGARIQLDDDCAPRASLDGGGAYMTGALGGGLGLKWVWIVAEVAAGYVATNTTVRGELNCPEIDPDSAFDFDFGARGLLVAGEIGVLVRF